MKERPILFNTDMVKAILDGTKTQTRRVIKLREFQTTKTPGYDFCFRDKKARWQDYKVAKLITKKCPYGAVGDELWVRETWVVPNSDGCTPRDITPTKNVLYKATDEYSWWRPSIHMPRWASRIQLKVKEIRVERLQDITKEDAIAEGFAGVECQCDEGQPCTDCYNTGFIEPPEVDFIYAWDSIYKKRGWDVNPWVWVVKFEVM